MKWHILMKLLPIVTYNEALIEDQVGGSYYC